MLEQVSSEVRMVAEGLVALDRKVDRCFTEVRHEMSEGFTDMRAALTELAKDLKEHVHMN